MRPMGIFDLLLAAGKSMMDFVQPKPGRPHAGNYGRQGGGRLRGVGYTRKSKEESKVRRKMAAKSRAINRKH